MRTEAPRCFVDDCCANCLHPLNVEQQGLFCSAWCSETASSVRYFRRVFRDGRINDPDVRFAVITRLAFLPAGGYAALERNLSPQVRAAVKERDGGLCRECGQPGTEIDHIASSSADMDNLQLLCSDCHRRKTASSMVPADERTRDLINELMVDRVYVEEPRLLADDEVIWDKTWRRLKAERKQRLQEIHG
jgi:hypothetical protein